MVRRHCTERTDLILLIRISSHGTKGKLLFDKLYCQNSVAKRKAERSNHTHLVHQTVMGFRPNVTYSRSHCPDDAIGPGVTDGAQGCFVMPHQFVCRNKRFERTASRSTEGWAISWKTHSVKM